MTKTNHRAQEVAQYLQKPYARILTPDPDGDVFVAQILEFPGCIAEGATPASAYDRLEKAAADWIDAVIEAGDNVPEPAFDKIRDYNGKVALRLPRTIHREAVRLAELDRTSLNTFLVSSVSAAVGAVNMYEALCQRFGNRTWPRISEDFAMWWLGHAWQPVEPLRLKKFITGTTAGHQRRFVKQP